MTSIEPYVLRDIRIVTLDIETKPMVLWGWGLYNQDHGIHNILDHGGMASWAGKVYGTDGVQFASEYHDGRERMLERLWELLDSADVVVGWNSDRFDIPHINREFLQAGLNPVAPYRSVDLMKVVKKNFKFNSNKLDYVAQQLGVGQKVATHQGRSLWDRCFFNNDEDDKRRAWALMRRYNKGDVIITEAVYDAIRGWISNHPPLQLYTGEESCNRCGCRDFQPVAKRSITTVSSFEQFRCLGCGGFSKAQKREAGTTLRGTA